MLNNRINNISTADLELFTASLKPEALNVVKQRQNEKQQNEIFNTLVNADAPTLPELNLSADLEQQVLGAILTCPDSFD